MHLLSRLSEGNDVLISSHIWVGLSTFKQLKKFLKNLKKLIHIFMNIFVPTKLFIMMNRHDPTVTLFDGLFL